MRSSVATPSRSFPTRVLIGLILIGLNLFVYAQVRTFEFVNFDDPTYVTANAHVLSGLSWTTAKWALTTGHAPYWHPLTWLSHLFDVTWFGLDAGAHHLVSLAIHAATTLLLFGWIDRATGARWRAMFVAAVFAVHPLHVESVAWIAERKDVLSAFFWVLTLWTYSAYVARPDLRRYAWVLVSFALALMAKPMAVTLPVVLLLVDMWPLRRIVLPAPRSAWMPLIREKLPLVAIAIAVAIVTVVVQSQVGAVADLTFVSWTARLGNAVVSYLLYVGMCLWPDHLAVFYPLRPWAVWQEVSAAIALIAITGAVVVVRRRHAYLLAGWGWYLVTLAPVIGVVQVGQQAMADRFMYLPMVGLLVCVAWGVPDIWRRRVREGAGRRALPAMACLVVLLYLSSARTQVTAWSDSVTLWRHAIAATGGNYLAYENLGQSLRERSDPIGAAEAYYRALSVTPAEWTAYRAELHNSLGLVFERQGKVPEALDAFSEAIRLDSGSRDAWTNAGNTLASVGRLQEASAHYSAALKVAPDLVEARLGLADVLLEQGQTSAATTEFTQVLHAQPTLAEAHNGLGAALAMDGHSQEALTEYQVALQLKPELLSGYVNMAVLLMNLDRRSEARECLERALAIDPSYEPARQLLRELTGSGARHLR